MHTGARSPTSHWATRVIGLLACNVADILTLLALGDTNYRAITNSH